MNRAYKEIEKDTIEGNYTNFPIVTSKQQELNRVGCDVTLKYKDGDCAPDLIIWGEGKPPQNMRNDWPILLVCEIKTVFRKKRGYSNNKKISVDKEKIEYLLRIQRAQSGYLLLFYYPESDGSFIPDTKEQGFYRFDIKYL